MKGKLVKKKDDDKEGKLKGRFKKRQAGKKQPGSKYA